MSNLADLEKRLGLIHDQPVEYPDNAHPLAKAILERNRLTAINPRLEQFNLEYCVLTNLATEILTPQKNPELLNNPYIQKKFYTLIKALNESAGSWQTIPVVENKAKKITI